MKRITAYIKPHRLDEVTLALRQVDNLIGMSVSDGRGFGRGRAGASSHGGQSDGVDFIPHTRIEIVCGDDLADTTVSTIQKNAHTGIKGDGKIYVSNVESGTRISTGEQSTSEI